MVDVGTEDDLPPSAPNPPSTAPASLRKCRPPSLFTRRSTSSALDTAVCVGSSPPAPSDTPSRQLRKYSCAMRLARAARAPEIPGGSADASTQQAPHQTSHDGVESSTRGGQRPSLSGLVRSLGSRKRPQAGSRESREVERLKWTGATKVVLDNETANTVISVAISDDEMLFASGGGTMSLPLLDIPYGRRL